MKSQLTTTLTSATTALFLAICPASTQTISYVDLHPEGAVSSYAADVSGNQQVGTVYGPIDRPYTHAARWVGSAASYLRLEVQPPGRVSEGTATQNGLHGGWIRGDYAYLWDEANGVEINLHSRNYLGTYLGAIGGDQQVGLGLNRERNFDALLWRGTSSSVVNLTPPSWTNARADDTDGFQQVGTVTGGFGGPPPHAALWEGSAESFVDLHPAGFDSSRAFCVSEGWQGGTVHNGAGRQAALWSGTPESLVLLHPAGAEHSEIWAIDRAWQVGKTENGGMEYAALWNDSSASHVNLHDILAGDGYTESFALGVEAGSSEIHVVGYARAADGERHAMMWMIEVPDTTPPVIENVEVDPPMLWPPNRKLRPIDLRIRASDDSGSFHWSVMNVTCNEDCDDSDILITDHEGEQQLALRAKRSGRNKQGRIYTLEFVAWDDAGNVSDPVYRSVTVPHDMSGKSRPSRK